MLENKKEYKMVTELQSTREDQKLGEHYAK